MTRVKRRDVILTIIRIFLFFGAGFISYLLSYDSFSLLLNSSLLIILAKIISSMLHAQSYFLELIINERKIEKLSKQLLQTTLSKEEVTQLKEALEVCIEKSLTCGMIILNDEQALSKFQLKKVKEILSIRGEEGIL